MRKQTLWQYRPSHPRLLSLRLGDASAHLPAPALQPAPTNPQPPISISKGLSRVGEKNPQRLPSTNPLAQVASNSPFLFGMRLSDNETAHPNTPQPQLSFRMEIRNQKKDTRGTAKEASEGGIQFPFSFLSYPCLKSKQLPQISTLSIQ